MRVESRKVQKVGTSTLSVSLPRTWVEKNDIHKGDIVLFEDLRDGSLRLASSSLNPDRSREVVYEVDADLVTEKGMLGRIVVGAYVIGRNRVVIRSKDRIKSAHLKEVREAVNKLMGLGIMLETADTVELQCSIDASRFPMETVIKRLYTIGATMQKEAIEALVRNDPRLAQDAIEREDEADMVYWLALRLILTAQADPQIAEQIGLRQQLPIVGNRLICKNLEHVADYAENVARSVLNILDNPADLDPDMIDRIRRASDAAARIVQDGLSTIFAHDLRVANTAVEMRLEVEQMEEALLDDILRHHEDPALVANVRAVAWSVRRIAEYGSEIAVIGINRYLERDTNVFHKVDEEEAARFG